MRKFGVCLLLLVLIVCCVRVAPLHNVEKVPATVNPLKLQLCNSSEKVLYTDDPLHLYSVNDSRLAVNGLLRFHVIADSDSPEDQSLKLKVRDCIIKEVGPKILNMRTKEEVLEFLSVNIEHIANIAERRVKEEDIQYGASAEVGLFTFPVKSYGSVTLPAGRYEALRVVLGDGGGSNWWCVMFPPLCFVDTENAVALARDQERVNEILSEEEQRSAAETGEMEDIPVKVHFKVLELIRKSGSKLANVFN